MNLMRKYFIIFFFAFLFANLLALDALVIQANISRQSLLSNAATPEITASPTPQTVPAAKTCEFSCPQSCLDKINEATASIKTEKITSVPVVQTVTVIVTPPATQLKEYYVALGTGTGEGNDWKDIDNTDTKVDLSQFGKIKNIYFEVAGILHNDNVTANVRLYNVTDKQPVWNSEVTATKLKCQTLTSSAISLSSSSKTYRLQVKTTLNATVYVDQARLRVVTE
jgi:hypothetical protein